MQQSQPFIKDTKIYLIHQKVFVQYFKISLNIYIYILIPCCYMFRPHLGHHQATLIIGETTALYISVLCTIRHIVVFVVIYLVGHFLPNFFEALSVFLFDVVHFCCLCYVLFYLVTRTMNVYY
jgi:hypothetical protein